MSAPAATASFASCMVWTWHMTFAPVAFALLSQGSGLPKDNAMMGGFASSAASKNLGNTGMKSLMKPTANGWSVVVRMCAISFSSQSVSFCGWRPPKLPSAPAFETAAASVPPQYNAMGADMMG